LQSVQSCVFVRREALATSKNATCGTRDVKIHS
jgi:hypothetical protein